MKKRFALLLVTVLLCSLAACTGETEPHADSGTTSTAETEPHADPETAPTTQTEPHADPGTTSTAETEPPTVPSIDYTVFCGHYSDTKTVEGPCYTVSIIHVDNATKAIELSLSYVGINSSPLYTTEPIHASIASDHTVQFEWKDSWNNQGVGTLVLNPDDLSTVQLTTRVTEEAEFNRATLSTNDQYKTFTRR